MSADGNQRQDAAVRFVLALPKGRILEEIAPILKEVGIEPDPALFDDRSRALRFVECTLDSLLDESLL